jgi:hypothetical protein
MIIEEYYKMTKYDKEGIPIYKPISNIGDDIKGGNLSYKDIVDFKKTIHLIPYIKDVRYIYSKKVDGKGYPFFITIINEFIDKSIMTTPEEAEHITLMNKLNSMRFNNKLEKLKFLHDEYLSCLKEITEIF